MPPSSGPGLSDWESAINGLASWSQGSALIGQTPKGPSMQSSSDIGIRSAMNFAMVPADFIGKFGPHIQKWQTEGFFIKDW